MPSSPDQESRFNFKPLSALVGDTEALHRQHKVPTAVTIKEHIIILNVNSNRKSVSHGFLAGIFGVLDKFGVVVDLISTSEVHVSMAIEDVLSKKALDKVVKELQKSGTVSFHTRPFNMDFSSSANLSDWYFFPAYRCPSTGIWLSSPWLVNRCETSLVSPDACSPHSVKATSTLR